MNIEIGKFIYILNVDIIAPAMKQPRLSAYYAFLANTVVSIRHYIDKITSLLCMAVLLYVKKYCNTTSNI